MKHLSKYIMQFVVIIITVIKKMVMIIITIIIVILTKTIMMMVIINDNNLGSVECVKCCCEFCALTIHRVLVLHV